MVRAYSALEVLGQHPCIAEHIAMSSTQLRRVCRASQILSLQTTRTATAMSRWRTRRTSLLRRGAGDPQRALCSSRARLLVKKPPTGPTLMMTGCLVRRARECEDAAEEDWEAMLAEAARRNSRAGASDGTSVLHAVRAAVCGPADLWCGARHQFKSSQIRQSRSDTCAECSAHSLLSGAPLPLRFGTTMSMIDSHKSPHSELQVKWRRIVLDEAHSIKDRSTSTAKAVFALNSKYKLCLTGTPLQNRVGMPQTICFTSMAPVASRVAPKRHVCDAIAK